MKKYILLLILFSVLFIPRYAFAIKYSKDDMEMLNEFLMKVYDVAVCCCESESAYDTFDTFYQKKKMITFGMWYITRTMYDEATKYIDNGAPIFFPELKEPCRNYTLVNIKTMKEELNKIFGYNLDIPDNANGVIDGFVAINGSLVYPVIGDPGVSGPFEIKTITTDGYGYIRASCISGEDDEPQYQVKVIAILKEIAPVNGKKQWQVIALQEEK